MSLVLITESNVPPSDDEFEGTIFSAGPLFPVAGAADAMGHYLVVVQGAEPGKRIELDNAALTIGRDAKQATMVCPDTQVSRVHALVRLVNGKAVVQDLQSTNGTFVGATRVASQATLKEGNILRVGGHALRYERRSRRDVERTKELDRDLLKARKIRAVTAASADSSRGGAGRVEASSPHLNSGVTRSAITGSTRPRLSSTCSMCRDTASAPRCTR